ncbi:DDRGK domain-containing protein 1-like [Palaemon carinicauda]|uniref:DDRGK domain-containing protein 1-like n=1 Tax=Palaemon carinicauda TaxID=392227 RepID=UPI0035B5EF80
MDDIILYGGLILLAAALLGYLSFFKTKDAKGEARPERPRGPRPRPVGEDGGIAPNRVIANRQARARMRAAAARQERQEDSDEEVADDDSGAENDIILPEGKIGKKKLAKLQAKAEKRAAREADERDREEKKQRDEKLAEERRKEEALEAEEAAKREEQERLEREEREKRELEEYMAMKAQFEVEEEGFDENADEDAEKNLLQEFVKFVKSNKVVVLEDLAAKFQMKTQDCIKRVSELQKSKTLTGVIDDRGKFIYISQEELEGVAKFIRQRGR